MKPAPFPPEITLPRLGPLKLVEYDLTEHVLRTYDSQKPLRVDAHRSARLSAWPPETGIADSSDTARYIEA